MTDKIFNRSNLVIISAGLISILIGFYFLGREPVDGFVSLTVAPIILTFAFVVLIPLGIFIGGKEKE